MSAPLTPEPEAPAEPRARLPLADTIKAAIDPLTFYQRELSNAPPLIANRKGYAQKVLCPFHEEKDPSFTINAKTGA
ncbi:MAG: hypothetical protein JZU52_21855, partial [Lamprocystis purpurea]|nr:hypothetical protein [Lamprocystis purpurea]